MKDGKLRVLGVAADKRVAALPDVPTFAEQGIKDQDSDTLTGLVAPGRDAEGDRRASAARDRQDRRAAGREGEARHARLRAVANKPEEFGARIKSEIEKWGKVVRDAKLRVE